MAPFPMFCALGGGPGGLVSIFYYNAYGQSRKP